MTYSKSQRLIYIIVLLWVAYGCLGIYYNVNLPELAGYYASLTLFIGTYLWGEYKRTSDKTTIFKKGANSSREVIIYVTILLWNVLGVYGIMKSMNINNLTVYFSSLSPFVSSYLIYKTNKGANLPIFDGKSQTLIDNNVNNSSSSNVTIPTVSEPINENNSVVNDDNF